MKKISLHNQIFIAMIGGLIVGLGMNMFVAPDNVIAEHAIWWMDLIGRDIFIGGLKMIIAPLVLASIVTGITTLPRAEALGQIGGKMALYYVGTTSVAVIIGVSLILLIQPGKRDASQEVRAQREAELEQRREAFESATGLDPTATENRSQYLAYLAQEDGATATSSSATHFQRMQETEGVGLGTLIKKQLLTPMLTNPFSSLANANTLGIIFSPS